MIKKKYNELVSWMGIRMPVHDQNGEAQFVLLSDLITTVAGTRGNSTTYKYPHFAFTYEVAYSKEQLYVLKDGEFRVYDCSVDDGVDNLYIVQKHAYEFLLKLCMVTHTQLSNLSTSQKLPTLYNMFELEHRCLLHFNVVTTLLLPCHDNAKTRKYIEDSINSCHALLHKQERVKINSLATWLFEGVLMNREFDTIPERLVTPEENAKRAERELLNQLAEEDERVQCISAKKKQKAEKKRQYLEAKRQRQIEVNQKRQDELERRQQEEEEWAEKERAELQEAKKVVVVKPSPPVITTNQLVTTGNEIARLHAMEQKARMSTLASKDESHLLDLKSNVNNLRWQLYQVSTQRATIRHQLQAAEYVLEHYYQVRGLNPDAEPFII